MRRLASVILVLLLFGFGGSSLASDPPPSRGAAVALETQHRGVSWVAGREIKAADLEPLVENHVNWIVQTPFGWQRSVHAPQIGLATSRVLWGETDEGLRITTALARKLGIRTLLKPHIWLTDRSGGWRGEIKMTSDADWEQWFDNYRRFILHYARFAEANKIEALCVGTELMSTVKARPDDWRRIIAEVRAVYHGRLTYAANWYREFEQVPFWDALDFIGIQAYFPLSDKDRPTREELLAGWKAHLAQIERIQKKYDKPVLFTELGYRSAAGGASKPWEWPKRHERIVADLDLQVACYEAFFETFWDKPWFAGVYWWKWFPHHGRAGGTEHAGFTPQNKPAEKVMARRYGKERKQGSGVRSQGPPP